MRYVASVLWSNKERRRRRRKKRKKRKKRKRMTKRKKNRTVDIHTTRDTSPPD